MRLEYWTCVAAAVGLGFAGAVPAQEPPADAVRRATSLVRSQEGVNMVALLLRAGPGQLDEARRAELADSLEALAVGYSRTPEAAGRSIALTAVRALAHAGARDGEGFFPVHARLAGILEQVEEPRVRLAIVTGLAFSGTEARAAATLSRIAVQDPGLAYPAVVLLRDVLGNDGRVALRGLFLQDQVENESARGFLRQLALEHGWSRGALP